MNKREWNARIGACAVLFRDQKAEKCAQIAEDCEVSDDEAARMYVVGSLKNAVRNGTARSLGEALDRYESEQIGDRAVSVHGESPIAREVRRINAYNDAKGGKTASHKRNMGKVLGSLYVEWDASEADSAVDVVIEREGRDAYALHIEDEMTRYFEDYVSRLSMTAKASIRQLVHSSLSVDAIMAGKDSESSRLKERAKYLHHNFPAAEAITSRELLGMLRKYA